ncbi:MAG: phosphatase PAP2 family protein [Caldimicrobium sp.]|nr:phosphatase PAP2 family protein [Caldimicrobium sp.]MDW8183557.1 phosphatase PAP2 family protein [Caldimicrobium sp.]
MIDKLVAIDVHLFYLINGLRNPLFDKILPVLSNEKVLISSYLSVSFVLLVLFLKKGLIKRFLFAFGLLWLGFGLSDFTCGKIVKPLVERERPYVQLGHVYYYTEDKFKFLEKPRTDKKTRSFPSCHMSNAAFGSTFYSFLLPQGSPLFILFALLIGYSRIYLGHHFPGDIMGGIIIGFTIGFVKVLFLKWMIRRSYV